MVNTTAQHVAGWPPRTAQAARRRARNPVSPVRVGGAGGPAGQGRSASPSGRGHRPRRHRGSWMLQSGGSTPPEWLDTTKAPPTDGKDSKPRTCARNHRVTTGVITLIIRLVKAGSHLAISGFSVSLLLTAVPTPVSGMAATVYPWPRPPALTRALASNGRLRKGLAWSRSRWRPSSADVRWTTTPASSAGVDAPADRQATSARQDPRQQSTRVLCRRQRSGTHATPQTPGNQRNHQRTSPRVSSIPHQ